MQQGIVLGGLGHMVWGQISLKSWGTNAIHHFQTVTLYDSSSQTTNSAWYRQVPHTSRVREAMSLRAYNLNV